MHVKGQISPIPPRLAQGSCASICKHGSLGGHAQELRDTDVHASTEMMQAAPLPTHANSSGPRTLCCIHDHVLALTW